MKGMRATAGIAGCLLFVSVALQAEPLQTQMAMTGDVEVDAVRASVRLVVGALNLSALGIGVATGAMRCSCDAQ